jgi:hypothetical protein
MGDQDVTDIVTEAEKEGPAEDDDKRFLSERRTDR